MELILSLEQAVKISSSPHQYDAVYILHLPFEQAIQIKEWYQYHAIYRLHLPFEQAIQITEPQYSCLKEKRESFFIQATKLACDNLDIFCTQFHDLDNAAIGGCIVSSSDEL